jgi:hypothetical protein
MDGLWLVLVYVFITWRVSTHPAVNRVMWVFGSAVVAISIGLLFALFSRQKAQSLVAGRGPTSKLARFLNEIHELGHWRELGMSMAAGGVFWGLQLLAIGAIARADGFEFDFSQIAFLMVVKTVGTIVQLSPANLGAFQAATVYALERMFTEPSDARILAQIMFAFLTLPLLLGGAVAVAAAGVRFDDLRKHAHQAHRAHH